MQFENIIFIAVIEATIKDPQGCKESQDFRLTSPFQSNKCIR
jgi:hypothetical protein